jgi:hypothetical protein
VWRRETAAERTKSHMWCKPYGSVCMVLQYMYAGFSGDSHICMRVSVEIVAYLHGLQ